MAILLQNYHVMSTFRCSIRGGKCYGKGKKMSIHFRCPECGLMTVDGLTEMTYELGGVKVTIKDIPAQVCPNGHSYLDGYTAESVNRLVNRIVEDVNAYSKKLAKQGTGLREVVIAA